MINRIDVANEVLNSFSSALIEKRKNGIYIIFRYRDELISRRWQCRGQDFYPVWKRKYPGGGTSCIALSQLIRWVQNKPVLPLSSWEYWSGDSCRLVPKESVEILKSNKYPQEVKCVRCEKEIIKGIDWWNLNGVSGPCCYMGHCE